MEGKRQGENMPKISVIIPLYNKEPNIEMNIKSVLNQSFEDFEVIIVNDGSTDKSLEIANNMASKDNRIRVIDKVNEGVSVTRNVGIDAAIGEYVTFLDSDDLYKRDFLQKMYSKINGKDACYCGHYIEDDGEIKRAKMNFTEGDILIKYISNTCTPHTNSWLISKIFLDKHDIIFTPGINWGEDMLFFTKVLTHCTDIVFVKEFLTQYNYCSVPGSLSENNIDKIEKDINWMKLAMEYIESNIKDEKRKKKAMKAYKNYRLPGAVVYRLYLNKNNISKEEMAKSIEKYSEYINDVKMVNGLRSLKLMVYKKKVVEK